jgi:hypothetical protein
MDKSDLFVYIFIGLVVVFSIHLFLKSDMVNLKCIISEVDGNTYCVRDRAKLKDAADLLASVTGRCTTLVNYLYNTCQTFIKVPYLE